LQLASCCFRLESFAKKFFCKFLVGHVKLLNVNSLFFRPYIWIQFGDFGLSSRSNQVNKSSCDTDAFKKIKKQKQKATATGSFENHRFGPFGSSYLFKRAFWATNNKAYLNVSFWRNNERASVHRLPLFIWPKSRPEPKLRKKKCQDCAKWVVCTLPLMSDEWVAEDSIGCPWWVIEGGQPAKIFEFFYKG
jgi:hypothetical protein